ncbi:glycosyltransferase family 4 protein [Nodosilinea sp. PGN35]|uniref:glycosyltransferase family 4 protein n=1 Tax=Nodosilinea sp. PGN35 TaxID=3020489 RepID=UPI0023B25876|nr:glycosyltransferase family 4 protein [Nodosilinea sp. TSF1-S3]MDF0364931.1 glycosyltransferase family 4 protein [Nodosilinea sp. TSF1-S3]
MHITYLTGNHRPDQDGVADYLANLRSHLHRRDITTTVLTTHDSARTLADPTVQGALSQWKVPQLIPLVQRILATPTDLLHIQHAAGSYRFERSVFLLPLLLRMAGYRRPIVTTAHEYGWWEWQPRWFPARWLENLKEWGQARTWWDREDGFLLTGSDAILTTNENITRIMQERLPKLRDRIATIPIAANLTVAPIDRATARPQLRHDCRWPQDAAVVAFFGFLHPVKGIEPLLQGFRQVVNRHPQARLLLMGGIETLSLGGKDAEQYWQKVQAQIRDLGLTDRVHCTGYIDADRASRYLSGSDLGVLPFNPGVTLKSGSLLALLAHRLPTIATRTAETDATLIENQVIVPVPPRNGAALGDAIAALLQNPQEQQHLATAGHSFVQSFSWTAIADRHHEIYQRLLTPAAIADRTTQPAKDYQPPNSSSFPRSMKLSKQVQGEPGKDLQINERVLR